MGASQNKQKKEIILNQKQIKKPEQSNRDSGIPFQKVNKQGHQQAHQNQEDSQEEDEYDEEYQNQEINKHTRSQYIAKRKQNNDFDSFNQNSKNQPQGFDRKNQNPSQGVIQGKSAKNTQKTPSTTQTHKSQSQAAHSRNQSYFKYPPKVIVIQRFELWHMVFDYLKINELVKIAGVSKFFFDQCSLDYLFEKFGYGNAAGSVTVGGAQLNVQTLSTVQDMESQFQDDENAEEEEDDDLYTTYRTTNPSPSGRMNQTQHRQGSPERPL